MAPPATNPLAACPPIPTTPTASILTSPYLRKPRQKIFELAAKAGYFQKDVDSHRKHIAFTGKKTLTYKDAQRSG